MKAVGEEGDNVELFLKLRLTTLKFKTSDALLLVQQQVSQEANGGFIAIASTDLEITDAEVEDGEADVEAQLHTKLLPQLNTTDIVSHLAGKRPAVTESYLKSLPNFSQVEIELSPKLTQALSIFPRRAQNITLKIEAE